ERVSNFGAGLESCLSGLGDRIADSNLTRTHDPRIDAPKVERPAHGRIHEFHRIEPESTHEFLTAGMRLVGYRDDRRADAQLGPRRQVRLTQVEIHEQLVSGQVPAALVLSEQRNGA